MFIHDDHDDHANHDDHDDHYEPEYEEELLMNKGFREIKALASLWHRLDC